MTPLELRRARCLSLLILLVIGLQAGIGLGVHKRIHLVPGLSALEPLALALLKPPRLYPFLDYPMYTTPHFPGDSIDRFSVQGVMASGEELLLDHRRLQASIYLWRGAVDHAVAGSPEVLVRLVERYQQREEVSLALLRIVNEPIVLERDGLSYASAETLLVRPLP